MLPKDKPYELIQLKGRLSNHKSKRNAECVAEMMRQLTIVQVIVPYLLRYSIKEGMIGLEEHSLRHLWSE